MALHIGIEPAFVLYFDCPEKEMERRLLNRNEFSFVLLKNGSVLFNFLMVISNSYLFWIIKGRDDDNIETIKKQFNVFLESSLPVITYYDANRKVRKVIGIFVLLPSFDKF